MKKLIFCFLFSLLACIVSAQEYGWTDISANIPSQADLSDVFFVSDNEGWITTSSFAEIYHTTNGGESFEIQTTQYSCNAIFMINENEGYAGGANGRVYRTTDGGENWIAIGSIGVTLTDIDFATTTQGYCIGFDGSVFSITAQEVENLNSGLSSDLSGVSAPSVDNVWICGGNNIVYFNGFFFDFQSGPVGTYNVIYFINENEGWIVGTAGLMAHTDNGGENWYTQINPDPDENSLYGLFFLDENNGWTIGSQGTILKTSNGGDTWVFDEEGSTLAGTGFLRGIHFTSPTNGYVVGNGNTILKFSDLTSADSEEIPADFLGLQNHPNPFNPETEISYQVSEVSNISLIIYDIKGQLIKTLVDDIEQSGVHSVVWSGKDDDNNAVCSGVYFSRLVAGNAVLTKRMVLLK